MTEIIHVVMILLSIIWAVVNGKAFVCSIQYQKFRICQTIFLSLNNILPRGDFAENVPPALTARQNADCGNTQSSHLEFQTSLALISTYPLENVNYVLSDNTKAYLAVLLAKAVQMLFSQVLAQTTMTVHGNVILAITCISKDVNLAQLIPATLVNSEVSAQTLQMVNVWPAHLWLMLPSQHRAVHTMSIIVNGCAIRDITF